MHPRAGRLLSASLALGAVLGLARHASAQATYFLLEAETGLAQSAYQGGDIGTYYGLRSGLTFKPVGAPIRLHLLLGSGLRSSQLVGAQGGLLYTAEQYDVDLYVSSRLVVPVLGLRAYAEVGAGSRLSFQSLQRDPSLGGVSVWSDELLLFVALGLQVRLTDNLSAGLRFELNPLTAGPSLISRATGHDPTELRGTGIIHVGFHF